MDVEKIISGVYCKHTSSRRSGRIVVFLLLLFSVFTGCALAKTARPDVHELNWERAFNAAKPDNVRILNSGYWRSAHVSREFEYFFKLQKNEKLLRDLFKGDAMQKLDAARVRIALKNFARARPAWFAPGDPGQYEVYIYAREPRQNFRLIIHKQSRVIYMTDYIL